ncbi:unnamed protein product, partial [Discosporangium mesarthrocarpum]
KGEGEWKGIYCSLLVLLEAVCPTCTDEEGMADGSPDPRPPLALGTTPSEGFSGSPPAVGGDDGASSQQLNMLRDTEGETFLCPSTAEGLAELSEVLAEALEAVPQTYESLSPPVPVPSPSGSGTSRERQNAGVVQCHRRRQWLIACLHLILSAAARVCRRQGVLEASKVYMSASRGEGQQAAPCRSGGRAREVRAGPVNHVGWEGLQDVVPKLLVSSLPLRDSSTEADDPTAVWLSLPEGASASPLSPTFPGISSRDTSQQPGSKNIVPHVGAQGPQQLLLPVPWEGCGGLSLPRHTLAAPWAGDAQTRALASDVIAAACALGIKRHCGNVVENEGVNHGKGVEEGPRQGMEQRLGLVGYLQACPGAAESLALEVRAVARKRGGMRDGAGVGVKHAMVRAIRSLRFPMVMHQCHKFGELGGVVNRGRDRGYANGGSITVLGHVLPLALPLADDYDPVHQALGFSLLLHLVRESSPPELNPHREFLLDYLKRALKISRDPSALALCLAVATRLLRFPALPNPAG